MTMSRAEYETTAAVFHNMWEIYVEDERTLSSGANAIEETALEFASAMCATNDRFDPARFLQQCAIPGLDAKRAVEYSHSLRIRMRSGVGATRAEIVRERGPQH